MSKFLCHRELGPAIIELMKGANVRCAVAFWGNEAVRKLFPDGGKPYNAQIICDLTMGGTNPKELEALGAPDDEGLKQLPGLHAKVYMSDRGLITCSANASNNGIGFLDMAMLVEAGTFNGPETDTYKKALRWFDEIWNSAEVIDESALSRAQISWERTKNRNPPHAIFTRDPSSLLDTVVSDPRRFRAVGFAFVTSNSTIEQRDETATAVAEKDLANPVPILSPKERKAIEKWPVGDVFSEWAPEDIRRWPERFVCAQLGARTKRLSYWFYERAYTAVLDDERGMLLGRRFPELRKIIGFKSSIRSIADADSSNASLLFAELENADNWFFANGEELANVLLTLAPWR